MSKLFQSTKVGRLELSHRVVLAPLTRIRANDAHVPAPTAPLYYSQRGSTPGTLLITEATFIAQRAGGLGNVPGIWNAEQIREWKKVTEAVHAKGSYIYMQLWALGRAASQDQLKSEDPALEVVSASDVPIQGESVPRPLTKAEIQEYVETYVAAARNALEAGFDGVEIHSANGYLLDQFLQTNSNKRTDDYGGSVENRARFTLQVVDAISKAIGEDRTAIRLSPWSQFQDMRMPDDKDVHETFSYVVTRIRDLHPNLAYIHLVEPRVSGNASAECSSDAESNNFIHDLWSPRPLIRAGQFNRETALELADKTGNLIAFGRHYISNPDLPERLRRNIPLTPYDRSLFYLPGEQTGKGYTDWPFAEASHF